MGFAPPGTFAFPIVLSVKKRVGHHHSLPKWWIFLRVHLDIDIGGQTLNLVPIPNQA
jgi:hypothetical protein